MTDAAHKEALGKHLLEMEKRVNPFAYTDHFTVWELVKCIVGIVVVPVRFFFAGAILIGMWVTCTLATSFNFDETRPLTGWRRFIMYSIRYWCRAFLFVFGFYWIKVKGKPARKRDAPIAVIAPHSTFVDSFVVVALMGNFSGLGKKEARSTPIFGSFFKAGQIIPVDRETPDGRKKALAEFNRRAVNDEKEPWNRLVVFPEGTCTNRLSLITFLQGAFVPGTSVQPVVLKWPYKNFDPTWTSSGPSRFFLILRLLTQVYNNVEVEFLPVYEPDAEEKADPVLYANHVRDVVADVLDVPVTAHSYEDTFLSMAARKSKFNPEQIVDFEFRKLKELLGLNLKEAKRLLRKFGADAKVKKTGKMNVAQFAKALDLPLTQPVVDMFALLDTQDAGVIDFKAFLVGLTFVSQNATPSDGVDVLFAAMANDDGKIDAGALDGVFSKVFHKGVSKKSVARLFRKADPEGTGVVDKAQFTAFLDKNPELLVAGLRITSAYEAKDKRPLSIVRRGKNIGKNNKDKKSDDVGPIVVVVKGDQDQDQDQD